MAVRMVGQVLAGAVLVLGPVLGVGAPAFAQNQLVFSTPGDGSLLPEMPDEVRLTFQADLDPQSSEVSVTGPDGVSAAAGEPSFDGANVTVPLRFTIEGRYEVAYQVSAADGHEVEGNVSFVVRLMELMVPVPGGLSPSPVNLDDLIPTVFPPPVSVTPMAVAPAPGEAANDGASGSEGWQFWLATVVGGSAAGLFLYLIYFRSHMARVSRARGREG